MNLPFDFFEFSIFCIHFSISQFTFLDQQIQFFTQKVKFQRIFQGHSFTLVLLSYSLVFFVRFRNNQISRMCTTRKMVTWFDFKI